MEKQLLRVSEAADLLNVSRWTVYRWVDEERLKATKIGKGSLRIFRSSITDLIDKNRCDALGPRAQELPRGVLSTENFRRHL